MKRRLVEERDTKVDIINYFGKQKLYLYARSFRNLAKTYNDMDREIKETESRQDYIVKSRLYENREILADHINELADVLCTVAKENIMIKDLSVRQEKMLARSLKSNRLVMDKFCYAENENGLIEVSADLAYVGKGNFSTSKAAKIFSAVLNHELVQKESSSLYIMDDFMQYVFVCKPVLFVETGVARAVKETEKFSGDSYGFSEDEKGRFSMLLSDGMGSGDKAMADSELVIELSEHFLEAGYPLDKAMRLINGALVSGVDNKNMSTLDICDINLHTGESAFAKVGASVSFIKRDNYVEKIVAGNLPLGIFVEIEPEIITRTLKNGDYIIMISDGVLDGLGQVIGEEGFYDFLCAMDNMPAKEMANHLLNYVIRVCNGKIRDDMTILVAKVIDF